MNNYNIKKNIFFNWGLLSFSIKRELHSYFNPLFFISYTNNIKNYLINQIRFSKMNTRMKKGIHNIIFLLLNEKNGNFECSNYSFKNNKTKVRLKKIL